MSFKPMGPYVMVKPDRKEKQTKSGIILQESKENSNHMLEGEVVALGTGVMLSDGVMSKFNSQIGDRVLFKDFAGIKVYLGEQEEEYHLLLETDILGVMENG